MKLRRLILGRYGHLSDVEIEFPDNPGLHIVLGANEAGKSTALSAIGDCLFRFPDRTNFAFQYATKDLRVGATLQTSDGRSATFFRRKGRKDDLTNENEALLPESALAPFLAGANRGRFNSVFGLNGAELRSGGQAILDGKGDVGEAILGAHTGQHGFRDLVARLDVEAAKLFGTRHGRRTFHVAAERYQAARIERDTRRIDPAAWKQLQASLEKLELSRAENAARARALHVERSQLNRIRATTPARRDLLTQLAARADLGAVPDLPADAPAQFQHALDASSQAARDIIREQARLGELSAALNALPENQTILAEATAIDDLIRHCERIAGEGRDRVAQRLIVEQRQTAMLADVGQLGLSLDVAALVKAIPNALDREAATQTLRRHNTLAATMAERGQKLADSDATLGEARAYLDAMEPVDAVADLRGAIEAVKAEGRLDAQVSEAATAVAVAREDLARAMASLPLWDRDAATLASAPIPMVADIQRLTADLDNLIQAVSQSENRLVDHNRALADLAAQALADAAGGALPTKDVIQSARARRDAAWAAIRRAYLDGLAPLTAAEAAELGLTSPHGDALTTLIHAADDLADRRADERERMVAAELLQTELVRRKSLRNAEATARAQAKARLDAVQAQWHALWDSCGIVPLAPPAMREWMQRRDLVLKDYREALDAERKLDTLGRRKSDAFAALAALLPAEIDGGAGSLATLLRTAEHICKAREDHASRLATARIAVESAASDQAKAARSCARVEKDLADWQQGWAATAQSLSLPPGAAPSLGDTALNLWNRITEAAREHREAENRVEQMTASIGTFRDDFARIAAHIAPDLTGHDPLDGIKALTLRLADARQVSAKRTELTNQISAIRIAIEIAEEQQQTARDRLSDLCAQAGAAEVEALREAITRWTTWHQLTALIQQRQAELRGLDDGKTLTELQAEAENVDIDALPARIAEIDIDLDLINKTQLADHESTVLLQQQRAEMERGRDAATAAQDMETALVDMDEAAQRYVPLRIAHTLLRAGIEGFRRQQQGPLLRRAGMLFSDLTGRRYERLDVAEDDDGALFVLARRPDGSECKADRLSEGTLDQLYLALRLAAIEADATAAEPLPFIGDDLLVNFDDHRARAALQVLSDFSRVTQVILFTHHDHIAAMASPSIASLHRLDRVPVAA